MPSEKGKKVPRDGGGHNQLHHAKAHRRESGKSFVKGRSSTKGTGRLCHVKGVGPVRTSSHSLEFSASTFGTPGDVGTAEGTTCHIRFQRVSAPSFPHLLFPNITT